MSFLKFDQIGLANANVFGQGKFSVKSGIFPCFFLGPNLGLVQPSQVKRILKYCTIKGGGGGSGVWTNHLKLEKRTKMTKK